MRVYMFFKIIIATYYVVAVSTDLTGGYTQLQFNNSNDLKYLRQEVEENTVNDFYSLLPQNDKSAQNCPLLDFIPLIKKTQAVRDTYRPQWEIATKPVVYGVDIEEIIKNGESNFFSAFNKHLKTTFETDAMMSNFESYDIFKLVKRQIIDPLMEDDKRLFTARSKGLEHNMSGNQENKTLYSANYHVIQELGMLISAVIHSYQFGQKMNLFLSQGDFINFVKHSNAIQNPFISEYENNRQLFDSPLKTSYKKSNTIENFYKIFTDFKYFKSQRMAMLRYNKIVQEEKIKEIYETIKLYFGTNYLFDQTCYLLTTFSDKIVNELQQCKDTFDLSAFIDRNDELFDDYINNKDSIFLSARGMFIRHCICRIHTFLEILRKNNDTKEYILLCKDLRQLKNKMLFEKQSDNFKTEQKNFLKFLNHRMLFTKEIRNIISSYVISTVKTTDLGNDLNSALVFTALRIFAAVNRIFTINIQFDSSKFNMSNGNNVMVLKSYCRFLSRSIYRHLPQ